MHSSNLLLRAYTTDELVLPGGEAAFGRAHQSNEDLCAARRPADAVLKALSKSR